MFQKYVTDLEEWCIILSARLACQKSTCFLLGRLFSSRAPQKGECYR